MRGTRFLIVFCALASICTLAYVLMSQDKVKRKWDEGEGRPPAVTVKAGETKRMQGSISGRANPGWEVCTFQCNTPPVGRYPLVHNLSKHQLSKNCFILHPTNRVPAMSVGASKNLNLSVGLSADASEIRACVAPGSPTDGFIVIWSDSSAVS